MLTRMIIMHMIRKQPSTSRPCLPMSRLTVLVTPIAPSPITMIVSRLIRSIRCVFLKLNMRQEQDIVTTAIASIVATTYQTRYTSRWFFSTPLNAGVMAANAPMAIAYMRNMRPRGRYNLA
jgi:hypothetical protein